MAARTIYCLHFADSYDGSWESSFWNKKGVIADLFIRLSAAFLSPETSVLFHMDIKERKIGKKSKIIRKPERNTELSRRKWT